MNDKPSDDLIDYMDELGEGVKELYMRYWDAKLAYDEHFDRLRKAIEINGIMEKAAKYITKSVEIIEEKNKKPSKEFLIYEAYEKRLKELAKGKEENKNES